MSLELLFFASPMAKPAAIEASTAWVRRELAPIAGDAGPSFGRTEAASGSRPVPVLAVLTGGTEDQVLARLAGPAGPALLLALPHSNSLPACLEILARLRQDGRAGRIVVAGRGEWLAELSAAARSFALHGYMSRARLGLLGGASSWLTASSPDPKVVRRVWGPKVVTIALEEVASRYRSLQPGTAEAKGLASGLAGGAAGIGEPDAATMDGAARLYLALSAIAAENELDALTIRCFDLLGELSNTGCFALSRLNDEGLTAACEGDLPSALTMMVLGGLSGQPCFMANPSDVDLAAGTVTFGHCSVPLGLVKTYRLRSHFESGLGVGLEGHFAGGKMTVARIGGQDLGEVTAFAGEIVPESSAPFREELCRTQVTLRVGQAAARELLTRPLGNHHILTAGDHVGAVLDYYSLPPLSEPSTRPSRTSSLTVTKR